MKYRLHQAALAQVHRTFTRQQPLTEETPGALEAAPLQKIALVGDQDISDEARMVQQKQMLARHVHVRHIAVRVREVAEERDRIAARSVNDQGP
jgi:hypothetical protein